MKYGKLGWEIFVRHLSLSLILVLQLTLSLLAVNLTIGQTEAIRRPYRIGLPLAEHKALYVMPANMEHPDIDLSWVEGIVSESRVRSYTVDTMSCVGYDDDLIKALPLPLKKGVWLSAALPQGDAIPVIVSREYPGLSLGDRLVKQLEDETLTFSVVGVLAQPACYTFFSRGGNQLNCGDLIENYDDTYQQTPLLLVQNSALPAAVESEGRSGPNFMLFFKPDIPQETFKNNQTNLAKQGLVVSTQEMALNGQKDMREQVTSFLPFILCIFSISLVGIISFNILSTLQQSRLFSILYICGARWRNCLSVCVGYVLCVCGFSLLLGGAFYSFARANGLIEGTGIVLGAYNVWWSLALYGIVLAATLLPPYILLKRQSPVDILRTEE